MKEEEIRQLLEQLIETWENEVVEFKEADNNFEIPKIGKYFSALSNEANLRGVEKAWLVFGVNDKTHSIVGTEFRMDSERLQSTKKQIQDGAEQSTTFRNIYEYCDTGGKRVILFEIPSAPRGIPISWNGHYFGRAHESLVALTTDKYDEIRQQTLDQDWSAQIVEGARISDLDIGAIEQAKVLFAQKHANTISEEEIGKWSNKTFLDKCHLTRGGEITRATLLLLGKPDSAHFLSPNPAEMLWKLEGQEQAYEHFYPPFLLTTTQLYQKIRNIQIRLLPQDQLLAQEISKYDSGIFLEALHNCIAHQDYSLNSRIVVTEKPSKLIFQNAGNFFEKKPDDYVLEQYTPTRYRNAFLVEAMLSLNMIDKAGYGIRRMNQEQAKRYLPLPDYDLTDDDFVFLTLYGEEVDSAYTNLLIQKTDLPLSDILALDRIQKELPLSDKTIKHLRKIGLIEGRKPKLYVSAKIANATASQTDYTRNKALDDRYYKDLIIKHLEEFETASKNDIVNLLKDKLSTVLSDKQKITKITNLLHNMSRSKIIYNAGVKTKPEWRLTKY